VDKGAYVKMDVVHIKWIDSESAHGWEDIEEIVRDFSLVHTVGLLLEETPEHVVVVLNFDPENNHINGRIHIPHVAIKEMATIYKIGAE
jgi:hypothetical protein